MFTEKQQDVLFGGLRWQKEKTKGNHRKRKNRKAASKKNEN